MESSEVINTDYFNEINFKEQNEKILVKEQEHNKEDNCCFQFLKSILECICVL